MQRIDEKTYIDDTLVTCAEYQLFIDEMLAQGKYYQPDHWTSYRFPEGQARKPILGVRHSDAVEFCGWLTKHNASGWKFRLPWLTEISACPMKSIGDNSVGIWLIERNNEIASTWNGAIRFAWIDLLSDKPRAISDGSKMVNLALVTTSPLDIIDVYDLVKGLIKMYSKNQSMVSEYSKVLNALEFAIDRSRPIKRFKNIYVIIEKRRFVTHDTDFDILAELLTLQERIAGRSPAFEGIRLVKERTR